MAASLGPLVGAIDQGTSSTRFLVSTARRSGRHRGQAAPPRPEGSRSFRAFTPLHPASTVPLGKGRGTGPQGRASCRGCSLLSPGEAAPLGPEVPDPPLSLPLLRSRRSAGSSARPAGSGPGESPGPASLAATPGEWEIPLLRAGCLCNLSGLRSVGCLAPKGIKWTRSSCTGELDWCEFGDCD